MATETVANHVADAENAGYKNGTADYYRAALASHSIMDMYYEGRGMLLGFYVMHQVTGDFVWLDNGLDMVEGDIDAAVNLQSYYSSIIPSQTNDFGGYRMPKWDALGNVMLPNRWTESPYNYDFDDDSTIPSGFQWYNPPLSQFYNTTGFSYNYVEARDENAYAHEPLGENIYYRYAADMLRIIYNNDDNGSILNLTSRNGQTYQQRCDKIQTHLEGLYSKWVEDTNGQEKAWFVYRQNTHMGNHLPSTALCLWVITGEQKYLDFVNSYLYTWGDEPNSDDVPSGSSFMKQMQVDSGNALIWSGSWGSTGGNQDINHAAEEIIFLVQCYEQGIGANPPSGVMAIDSTLITRLVNMIKNNIIDGSSGIKYRLNGDTSWFSKNIAMAVCYMARFDEEILDWVENNFSGKEYAMQWYANRAYAAAVHGIGGSSAPVYPSTGIGGSTPPVINNAPVVSRNGDFRIDLNVGDTYNELGASWADIEDGTGTVLAPTIYKDDVVVGSVDTNVVGLYVLTYQYTDVGGQSSNIEYRNVYINQTGNSTPVLNLIGPDNIVLNLGDPYVEQGASWTDAEDGSGTISSPSSGAVPVDGSGNVDTVGNYLLEYQYEDANGSIGTIGRNVSVVDNTGSILVTSIEFADPSRLKLEIGQSAVPEFIILPANATNQEVVITATSSSQDADTNALLQINGIDLIGQNEGGGTITITTTDGSGLSISQPFIVEAVAGTPRAKLRTRQLIKSED